MAKGDMREGGGLVGLNRKMDGAREVEMVIGCGSL